MNKVNRKVLFNFVLEASNFLDKLLRKSIVTRLRSSLKMEIKNKFHFLRFSFWKLDSRIKLQIFGVLPCSLDS